MGNVPLTVPLCTLVPTPLSNINTSSSERGTAWQEQGNTISPTLFHVPSGARALMEDVFPLALGSVPPTARTTPPNRHRDDSLKGRLWSFLQLMAVTFVHMKLDSKPWSCDSDLSWWRGGERCGDLMMGHLVVVCEEEENDKEREG